MTSKERAYLKGLASKEPSILQVGKGGVGETLINSVKEALEARELIKLNVLENAGYTPLEAAQELAEAADAVVVTTIGSKLVLYKKKAKDSKIGIDA